MRVAPIGRASSVIRPPTELLDVVSGGLHKLRGVVPHETVDNPSGFVSGYMAATVTRLGKIPIVGEAGSLATSMGASLIKGTSSIASGFGGLGSSAPSAQPRADNPYSIDSLESSALNRQEWIKAESFSRSFTAGSYAVAQPDAPGERNAAVHMAAAAFLKASSGVLREQEQAVENGGGAAYSSSQSSSVGVIEPSSHGGAFDNLRMLLRMVETDDDRVEVLRLYFYHAGKAALSPGSARTPAHENESRVPFSLHT
eukprot:6955346-Prymnesium_polylepis.1